MAPSKINNNCIGCGLSEKKMIRRKTKVNADDEAIILSDYFATNVVIGDILCQKCSGMARLAKSKQRKLEEPKPVVNTPQSDSQESTSSSDPPSQPAKNDPVYCPPEIQVTEKNTIELPFRRVISTHDYCCLCRGKSGIINVPFEARQQAFIEKEIFIPEGNRCCHRHLIKKRFYIEDLNNLKIHSNSCIATAEDITRLLKAISITADRELHDRIGDFSISEERIRAFTGLTWE